MDVMTPRKIDLKRDEALTVTWSDGSVSVYPIAYLRKMSPSASSVAPDGRSKPSRCHW